MQLADLGKYKTNLSFDSHQLPHVLRDLIKEMRCHTASAGVVRWALIRRDMYFWYVSGELFFFAGYTFIDATVMPWSKRGNVRSRCNLSRL